jgi:hypothetical protein
LYIYALNLQRVTEIKPFIPAIGGKNVWLPEVTFINVRSGVYVCAGRSTLTQGRKHFHFFQQ